MDLMAAEHELTPISAQIAALSAHSHPAFLGDVFHRHVRLRIEVDGSKATVTRNVKINKAIIAPAEWKSARALLTALADRAYSELIVK